MKRVCTWVDWENPDLFLSRNALFIYCFSEVSPQNPFEFGATTMITPQCCPLLWMHQIHARLLPFFFKPKGFKSPSILDPLSSTHASASPSRNVSLSVLAYLLMSIHHLLASLRYTLASRSHVGAEVSFISLSDLLDYFFANCSASQHPT